MGNAMGRFLLYICMLFSAIACGREAFRPRTGDLLFIAGGDTEMNGAIGAATGHGDGPDYTHVGIAVAGCGTDSVLEATTDGGVRMTALRDFLGRGATVGDRPAAAVMRLRDTAGVAASVRRARKFLGQPYDYAYRPDNGRMYCSELVWESYLAPDGRRLFPARPMNFRAPDGTMPVFWTRLFARLGEPVPEGVPGTNPNDLARDTALVCVHRYCGTPLPR